ncbi:MAG: phage portal protein [Planctomycetota bacterium]|nr:MAG: phage portal protein [Planctomycetota bacterium]
MIESRGTERGILEQLHTRLRESYEELFANYVDPQEPLFDDGEKWQPLLGTADDVAAAHATYSTEEQLQAIQAEARRLATTNEFAINGHENRISYLVGSGHRYRVVARDEADSSTEFIAQAQSVLDRFLDENAWVARQQEIVRRRDRDGEVFLRLFTQSDGRTLVRFVEPGQVVTPRELQSDPSVRFGVRTEPFDVETVLAYYVDGVAVDATEIQHRKGQVDRNARRGLPLFYPVRKNLRRAEKLLRNMSIVAEIQSAIALIRRHGAGGDSVQQFVADTADLTVTDRISGHQQHIRRYGPGTILDAPAGIQYDFPAAGLDAGSFVTIMQAELRAIASRLVMPEFMLTSDASNANYASTLVAEGPAVKMFSRLQHELIADDRALLRRVLGNAAAAGVLSEARLGQLEIQVTPPSLVVRNERDEADVHRIELESGILSPQTWSERRGLNYEQEQANFAAHQVRGSEASSTPTRGSAVEHFED